MTEKTESEEVPKGYKKTEIGILPEDWRVVRLGDYIRLLKGRKPKISLREQRSEVHSLYLSAEFLRNGKNPIYVSEDDKSVKVQKDEVIILWDGSNAGEVFITKEEGILASTMVWIVPSSFEKKFLFYYLKWKENLFKFRTTGSGIPHVDKKVLLSLMLPLPPLQEQKKIAKILDKIRQAIELQNREIETWRKMKKAVMAKVFREGLHGEELKDTEIGKVPKSWEVVRLGEVCHIIMGQSPSSSTYNFRGEGFPFFQGKAEFGDICPKIEKYTTHPLKMAKKGDILISVRAPVGDVNLAPTTCAIGRGLAAITPKKEVYAIYLFYLLKFYKNRIEARGTGSTFKAIRKSNLENLLILLPPLQEQKEIAHILSTIDRKIEVEKRRKEILEKLFKTMLHLLMTGKLRVKEVEI